MRGQKLAGHTIQHVVKSILGRLHEDFAVPAVQIEIGEHQFLGAVVIPSVFGHRLVVPGQRTRIDTDRDDGGRVELIATLEPAHAAVVGRPIAGPDVHEFQRGIVGHAIPNVAAAAFVPAIMGVPSRQRRRQVGLILWTLGGIAWDGVEPPAQRTGTKIVSGHIAASAGEVAAAVADDDDVARQKRCAGNRIGLARSARNESVDFPHEVTGAGVDRMQKAILSPDVEPSGKRDEPSVHRITARVAAPLAIDARIVDPDLPAGIRIERIHAAKIANRIHHAIDDQGRSLKTTVGAEAVLPREPEARDVFCVDVFERRVIRAIRISARRRPLIRLYRCLDRTEACDEKCERDGGA